MAYASVLLLAQTIEQILQYDDQRSSTSPHDHKQHLTSLHKHVALMQAFLDEYPDEATNLEGRITDISNKADDIIGTFMWERKSKGIEYDFMWESIRPYQINRMLRSYFKSKFSDNLRKITREMGSIVEELMVIKNTTKIKSDLHLSDSFSSPAAAAATGGPSSKTTPSTGKDHIVVKTTPSTGKDHIVVGFDEDLNAIKERLWGGPSTREVILIHGMGGIGKTTLARYAYDDPLITERFDIRAWVTMSQDYNVKDIISGLLTSLKPYEGKPREEAEDLKVHKILMGRRYLIVVDDIWSTKAWDDISRLFPNDKDGSRIMLTTRNSDLAACANSSSSLHKMRLMDVNKSWNLLREKVFKKGQCPPELEDIGKMMAESCRGLPLAIVVVAGILSTVDKTRVSWEGVAKHVISDVTNDEQFVRIFSLSYTHLPHHLRSCFLYLGAFPEDYEIRVSKLIKLWTAEGFMKTSGSKTAEDALEQYLEDLVQRSLILVSRRKVNGKIKCCSIHDLLRDLSIRQAEEQKFFLRVRGEFPNKIHFPSIVKEQRRVIVSVDNWFNLLKLRIPVIRTVLSFDDAEGFSISLSSFRLLRVLDIARHNRPFGIFPYEICELFFLRYLAIHSTAKDTFKVPSLILELQNLQTLVIIGGRDLQVEIPEEIWMVLQLRHLVLPQTTHLPNPGPEPLKALENLQTLGTVLDFRCSEDILRMIPKLRKLKIKYTRSIENWAEYQLHNLIHLHQLEKLSISMPWWDGTSFWGQPWFPNMLKKLKLEGFLLRRQDMDIIGSLPNLEVLKLISCNYEGRKWETTEGGFPKLTFIEIKDTNLEQWITEPCHIPGLKRLRFYKCRKLGEIPDEIGEIPSLELIEVSRENKSLVKSAKRIKEEQQQSYGNNSLQVRIVDL